MRRRAARARSDAPTTLRAAVAGAATRVVVVGHQPDCGRVAAALTGGDGAAVPDGRHGRASTCRCLSGMHRRPSSSATCASRYGRREALRGISFEIERGRGVRPARPERRRQDDDGRDPRGLPAPRRRRGRRPRRRPAAGGRRLARAGSASSSSRRRCTRTSPSGAPRASSPATTPTPRDVDEVIELVGLEEKRERARARRSREARSAGSTSRSASSATPSWSSSTSRRRASTRPARRAAWETIRSLRALGKTVLLTTHYLDEAEQLADRVAVLREGGSSRSARPAELTGARAATEIRYRRDGEEVVLATRRADARAARADGAGARRAATSSRTSRCAGRRSRRSTCRSPERRTSEAASPRAGSRAAALLAEPRARVLHVPAADHLLRPARLGLRRRTRSTACSGSRLPARRHARLRRRRDGVRRARDHPRRSAASTGSSSALRATPLPAWAYIAAVLGSTLFVFAIEAVGADRCSAAALFDVPSPGPLALARARAPARRRSPSRRWGSG